MECNVSPLISLKNASLFLATVVSFSWSLAALGQPSRDYSAWATSGNYYFSKLFGSNACIAKCSVEFSGASQESLTMDFALLDGKMRLRGDMTQLKHQIFPPAVLKEAGMDEQITIMRPDLKLNYCLYPHLKAFLTRQLSKDDAAALQQEAKIERTELSKETVDGHPCVKSKVVITSSNGEKYEALVWFATDLTNFPIRMQTTEQSSTASFTYKQIRFTKPDAKLFEPPADFTQYDDLPKLMEAAALRQGGSKR